MIHVYTGDGKGKTTAAVGLALRAKSRGLRVLFAQFMKGGEGGESAALKGLSMEVLKFDEVKSPVFHPEADKGALREEARRALASLKETMGGFDLVVLDEFNCVLAEGLVTKEEAVEFLEKRPGVSEVVLTGRGAPDWLIGLADYATEMRMLRHPYKRGIKARKGIEY
jgi:cob(I)alamin adenosyltransferase